MTIAPTAPADLDRALDELEGRKHIWAALPIKERIALLDSISRRVDFSATRWVEAAAAAKQFSLDSAAAAEEWLSGPYALLSGLHALKMTLQRLLAGKTTYKSSWVRSGSDGRAIVRVLPVDWFEPVILNGYSLDVWMQPQVTPVNLAENTAGNYRRPGPAGLCGILGAGNVGSIAPLDVLYKLYAEGQVVALKLSPVNEYLGPILSEIFVDAIDRGFFRVIYGDGTVGQELVHDDRVDTVHMTGSARTHDAIVWGTGAESKDRRRRNQPLLTKPITSELGGVSPLIVVPGPWTRADFQFQAENFATQKLLNGGFNCIATQVVILPSDWDGSEHLLSAIKNVIDRLPPRYPYYPGAEDRRRVVAAERGSVTVGATPVTWLPDLGCELEHRAFSEEFFTAAFAVTRLPADDLTSYLEAAVDFANDRLEGTLGANLLVHPSTARSLGSRLDQVIARLRYGAIAINTWTAFNFLQPRGSWGAFPGHTQDRVGSGIGWVHNGLLFDRPEKSVARGPFRPMPRSWLHGEFSLSPKPPWFVTSRTGATTARLFTRFGADHSLRHLPALFAAALRG